MDAKNKSLGPPLKSRKPKALKAADAGYSGKILHEKLGLKPGGRLVLLHAPADYFGWLGLEPENLDVAKKPGKNEPFIHVFLRSAAALESDLTLACKGLAPDGVLWASWRKGKADGIGDNEIRAWALRGALVDVKVCSVNEEWSGLKLMFRKGRRG